MHASDIVIVQHDSRILISALPVLRADRLAVVAVTTYTAKAPTAEVSVEHTIAAKVAVTHSTVPTHLFQKVYKTGS